jgi:hypothetical protein
VDRRADVVDVSGKRQLGGTTSSADRVFRLKQQNRASVLSQGDRCRETVRPRTDNDGIVSARYQGPAAASTASSES